MVDALTKCFSKRREAREAVTVRKEPLVLGYGGLSLKNLLVLMHPLLTEKTNKTATNPRALDPEQGSPLPAAGQKRDLFSRLPSGVACCCREQLACWWWGGERLGTAGAVMCSAVIPVRK